MEQSVAWIDDLYLITVSLSGYEKPGETVGTPFIFIETQQIILPAKIEKEGANNLFQLSVDCILPLGEAVFLQWGNMKIPVYPRHLVRTTWFDEQYSVSNEKFGVICNENFSIFTLWAPTATSVVLLLNDSRFVMKRFEKGIWKITVGKNCHGYTYEYEVEVNGSKRIVIDPYAKASSTNTAKGVVVDFSKTTNIHTPRPKLTHLQDSIIYELHVRDATNDPTSGITNRGKFLGLSEVETKTENGFSTGLSYIKELGVTHVELLPINDFARVDELDPAKDYNWGYDPLLYQVPEGSYSCQPNQPIERINECKQMIQSFHKAGIGVILDVVFNHIFIDKSIAETNFEKIVPGYYFRTHDDGTIANSTGCGNDLATERTMVRKFILDTIDFWLTEYQIDGFRFDLMGVIDLETMQHIRSRCQDEALPIMLLGEGWNLPTPLPNNEKSIGENAGELIGIRFFNDSFRDTLKGNLFDHYDKGFVNGAGRNIDKLPHLISGSCLEKYGTPFVPNVTQVINYVECHDNHTLWDRLLLTNQEDVDSTRKKIHQLATGLMLLSQGVPFLHGGQEWFRTKFGVENSYNAGDTINQLNWKKREEEWENIEYVKSLIQLRKQYDVFRLRSKYEIEKRTHILHTPHPVFGYSLLGDHEDFVIYVNPSYERYPLHLPSSGIWKVKLSNYRKEQGIDYEIVGEYTTIEPYELIVYMKSTKR